MTRKICYITGTRADFGLMRSTLEAVARHDSLELAIVVTGMHLSEKYGRTVRDVESSGLPIAAEILVDVEPPTGLTMARNIGRMLTACAGELSRIRPDVLLLLGDRGEMLAGALAAIHLNIPIAHLHGGERSGTVDEPVRHAISKLAHFHFVATEQARDRLIRMGERSDRVWVTGAPGLDCLASLAVIGRADLAREADFAANRPIALLVFHPVLQEADAAGADAVQILDALARSNVQVVALMPNSDAGSDGVRTALEQRRNRSGFHLATHFSREHFVSWMASADFMIGNSSAGIIEAATFGTPVVNIGSRQRLRERNANVRDVSLCPDDIESGIRWAIEQGRSDPGNVYGDGRAGDRIVSLLASLQLDPSVLEKANSY